MATQTEKAKRLRALHQRGNPLVLVNAWDAVSARIVEDLGFPAIATTSGGMAWTHGYADGEHILREGMLHCVELVTRAVDVPVTADLERGYGNRVEDAADTALGAIRAGAVGLNFEDSGRGNDLFDPGAQALRITAIRDIGARENVPLVINARTDVFLLEIGDSDEWRFGETVRRANIYLRAGADCAFVPGVTDEATIARLVQAIEGPVSVLAGAASPTVERMGELGVARISVGTASMGIALAHFWKFARIIHDSGDFASIAERVTHAQVNALFDA